MSGVSPLLCIGNLVFRKYCARFIKFSTEVTCQERFFFTSHRNSPVLINHSYSLPCLLIPWSRVLFEKLTGSQLVKKLPAFLGTRMFNKSTLVIVWYSSLRKFLFVYFCTTLSVTRTIERRRLGWPINVAYESSSEKAVIRHRCAIPLYFWQDEENHGAFRKQVSPVRMETDISQHIRLL